MFFHILHELVLFLNMCSRDFNQIFSPQECYVQNTAREYIKAYNNVAKAAESFGDVPEWVDYTVCVFYHWFIFLVFAC